MVGAKVWINKAFLRKKGESRAVSGFAPLFDHPDGAQAVTFANTFQLTARDGGNAEIAGAYFC